MKVSGNVYWQMPSTNLLDVLSEPTLNKFKNEINSHFLHAVNFFDSQGNNVLDLTQQTTFNSITRAKKHLEIEANSGTVNLLPIICDTDRNLFLAANLGSKILTRDASDLGGFANGSKLPLVFDLLKLCDCEGETDEYVIYTNSDICLQSNFYSIVNLLLKSGADSLIINRRTINRDDSNEFSILASADIGQIHPGMDCFIFPRKWIKEFVINKAITGVGQVNRGILMNLVASASRLLVLADSHLTYHYGDDRPWTHESIRPLELHNIEQAKITYNLLLKKPFAKKKLLDFFKVFPKYQPSL
jgi:hypothetical protein